MSSPARAPELRESELQPSSSQCDTAKVIQFFDKLITKKQLAEYLSVSESFINKLMVKEGLPYRQIGRAVRFSLREVAEWLSKRKRP